MRLGYSVKKEVKNKWKIFYFTQKLHKLFWRDLTFFEKIYWIFGGKI
jgi:hypothetical protein